MFDALLLSGILASIVLISLFAMIWSVKKRLDRALAYQDYENEKLYARILDLQQQLNEHLGLQSPIDAPNNEFESSAWKTAAVELNSLFSGFTLDQIQKIPHFHALEIVRILEKEGEHAKAKRFLHLWEIATRVPTVEQLASLKDTELTGQKPWKVQMDRFLATPDAGNET